MKILFLTTHYPSPPDYGAAKRAHHICRLLEDVGDVTLAILRPVDGDLPDRLAQTRQDFKSVEIFDADCVPPKGITGRYTRLLKLGQAGSRQLSLSEQKKAQLRELIRENDIVWSHTLVAADMGGIYDYGRSVIDLDDLNSSKTALYAKEGKGHVRWRHRWQSLLWRRWEHDAIRRFSAVAVCSEIDREKMGRRDNMFVLPNGFEAPKRPFEFKARQDQVIGFVGQLDYPPNAEAVRWFVKDILSILLKSEPTLRLRVAGKLPKEGLGISHPQVDVLGFVQDLDVELENWDAMVVPLKVGGGTRLKILEAFSKKVPVVSTCLGAYGIEAEHGKHLLLADDPEHFARECLCLIRDRKRAEVLAQNARLLFDAKYTWQHMGDRIRRIIGYAQQCQRSV